MILNAILVNLSVVFIILVLAILAIIHLVRVYRKNPCGDCSGAKECSAFSKEKILKEYRKACKKERKFNN